MPDENPLQRFYYSISDKSWAFAEWLEEKGLPLASFCDKYHMHPLLLLAVIAVVVMVLILLAAGALGGVSYGTLTVIVTSQGPLEGATVYYEFNGQVVENTTDALGRTEIRFPRGPELTVYVRKEGYKQNSQTFILEEETGEISISLERKVGDLVVNVDVAGGRNLPSNAYILVESPGEVAQTKAISNNMAEFEDLPAGLTVTAYVVIGNQRIPPGGENVEILEDTAKEITISIPESALTVSLEVRVRDSMYQNLDNVDVTLYDWNTGRPLTTMQTTYGGSVTFNDIVLGTSVYATVNPSSSQYGSYNGKLEGNRLDVTRDGLVYEVVLPIIGQVRVCVYDQTGTPLGTGTIVLRRVDGSSEASRSISGECEEFSGLPEGIAIYPEVNSPGYLTHADPSTAKTIDYSTITGFDVFMQPISPDQQATVVVHVEDCEGNPVDGIKVKIIDASTLTVLDEDRTSCTGSTSFVPSCGNAETTIEIGRDIYAVAFDDNYQLEKSGVETVGQNTVLDIITCEVSGENVGAVKVCAYKDGDPFDGADLELYDTGGFLRWTATTDEDEEDPDHCYTFINIPDGTVVYARAINLGTSPEVSGTLEIVGGQTGELSVYAGSPPVILDEGDVEVCVTDAETGFPMTANITLYDLITQQPIIAGETAGGGCRLFEGLTAETNSGGRIIPREIYIEVSKDGYGTYNSMDSGVVLEMVPNGLLTVNVNLSEAFEICVQVRASDDNRAMRADVVLYYNETADYPIERVRTDANGVAKFYQAQKDIYYFKLLEKYTLYDPKGVYELEKEEVSGGNCGVLMLYDLGTLCNLGLEILTGGDNLSVIAGQKLELPIRVLEDGRRADTSITDEGKTANKFHIQLMSGDEANLTLKLNNKFHPMSIVYGSTKYSSDQEIIAQMIIDEVGRYSGIFQISKNPYCSRQAPFRLKVYKEQLFVSTDSIQFRPLEEKSKSFCIYVVDQDDQPVTDAGVTIQVDEMDGWGATATRTAAYDEIRQCYRGVVVSSMAPDEGGIYPLNILVRRGNIKKIHQAEVEVSMVSPCGNGKVDSGEACDPAAEPTGCNEGLICTAECRCEEPPRGLLSVSADPVRISIGSGRSSGFCVRVTDDLGEVRDARVTANLYGSAGWPRDTSITASYDVAKNCYYVPISESVAWPRGVRWTGSIGDLMESKTISIAAVQGDRSAATTTTASFECGCDEERWCEWTCPCDEDCEEGGAGNFNLFNCLVLLNQHGYYPQGIPYPMSYPYPTSYTRRGYPTAAYPSPNYRPGGYTGYPAPAPGGMGITPGGMTMGGTSITSGGITFGGIGSGLILNLEECKKLFGITDDNRPGTRGYVLVVDELGVISGNRNQGTCKKLLDYLEGRQTGTGITTGSGAKFVYVQTGGGSSTCCTSPSSGGKCDRENFNRLVNSALKKGEPFTQIDITQVSSQNNLASKYGLNYKIIGSGDNVVLYDGSKLFAKGALFGARSRKTDGRATEHYVWGALRKGYGPAASALDVWFKTYRSSSFVGYPEGIEDDAKTIILTEYDGNELKSKGSLLTGDEDGLRSSMFSSLGEGTKLMVITDYTTLQNTENEVLKEVANQLNGNTPPKFETLKADELSYCHNGVPRKSQNPSGSSPGDDLTLLRVKSKLYMMGLSELDDIKDLCDYPSETDDSERYVISLNPGKLNPDAYKDIAYVKKRREKTLLMAGRSDKLDKFIEKFEQSPPTSSGSKIYTLTDGSNKLYGMIRAACHREQKCITKLKEREMRKKLTEGITFPKDYQNDEAKSRIATCICGGEVGKDPGMIRVSLDLGPNADINPEDFTLYMTVGRGGWERYSLSDDSKIKIDNSQQNNLLVFDIIDVPTDKGDVRLAVSMLSRKEGVTKCISTLTSEGEPATVEQSKLRPNGVQTNAPLKLILNGPCMESGGKFSVSGNVVDAFGLPVANAVVNIYPSDIGGASPLPVVAGSNSRTDNNGKFTIEVAGVNPGAQLYASAEIYGETTDRVPIEGRAARPRSAATTGSSSSPWAQWSTSPADASSDWELKLRENLKFKHLYQVGFTGTLKNKQGKPISGAIVTLVPEDGGKIVGGPMESPNTKSSGKYTTIGKVREGTYRFEIKIGSNVNKAYLDKELTTELKLRVAGGKLYKVVGDDTEQLSGKRSSTGNYMLYDLDLFADSSDGAAGTAPSGAAIICDLKYLLAEKPANAAKFTVKARVFCSKGATAYATKDDISEFKFSIGDIVKSSKNPGDGVKVEDRGVGNFLISLDTPIVRTTKVTLMIDVDGDGKNEVIRTGRLKNPITVNPEKKITLERRSYNDKKYVVILVNGIMLKEEDKPIYIKPDKDYPDKYFTLWQVQFDPQVPDVQTTKPADWDTPLIWQADSGWTYTEHLNGARIMKAAYNRVLSKGTPESYNFYSGS